MSGPSFKELPKDMKKQILGYVPGQNYSSVSQDFKNIFGTLHNPSENNNAAIKYAVKHNMPKVVANLLQNPEVDPTVDNNFPIKHAAREGYHNIFKQLLLDYRVTIRPKDLLPLALNHAKIVKYLLKYQKVNPNDDGGYIMLTICGDGRIDILDVVIHNAALTTATIYTGLMAAIRMQQFYIIELLLDHPNSDPNIHNGSLLMEAISADDYQNNNYVQVINLLLDDERTNGGICRNECIIVASARGLLSVVNKLLLDTRVNPADRDNSSIQEAARNGHSHIVKRLLLDKRVDPTVDDNSPIRLAWEAQLSNYREVIDHLLHDDRVRATLSEEDIYFYTQGMRT